MMLSWRVRVDANTGMTQKELTRLALLPKETRGSRLACTEYVVCLKRNVSRSEFTKWPRRPP